MKEPSKVWRDRLPEKQECVTEFSDAWRSNINRYKMMREYTFSSTLTEDMKSVLMTTKKPMIEFNIIKSYVSRALGEYAENEPSVNATSSEGKPVDEALIQFAEGHIRHVLDEARSSSALYKIYQDALSGGYSAGYVYSDWSNNKDFSQSIYLKKVFDPTMCGWDLMAQKPHKGDGEYCFQAYPRRVEEIMVDYPFAEIDKHTYKHNPNHRSGPSWAFSHKEKRFLLEIEYFKKETKRKKLLLLANNQTMFLEEYEEMLASWDNVYVPPVIVAERRVDVQTITRDIFVKDQLLKHEDTMYTELPIVFFDGNSIELNRSTASDSTRNNKLEFGDGFNQFSQMTIPMVYDAMGAQNIKNMAGQALANEIENLIQHKLIVAEEALPNKQSYLEAYTNFQRANTIVYQAFDELNPDKALPPPQTIQRQPIPGEILATFQTADVLTQNIMGSYENSFAKLGNKQMSGKALGMIETMSNESQLMYLYNHMQGLTQVAKVILGLIPKIHVTPKSVPTINAEGKRAYQVINAEGGVKITDEVSDLNIRVEAGVNSKIQKNQAVEKLERISASIPGVGEFLHDEGLEVVFDNLDIVNADILKKRAIEWMQKKKQEKEMMKQQAMQQQSMGNPMMMRAQNERMKIEKDSQLETLRFELEKERLRMEKMENEIQLLKLMSDQRRDDMRARVDLDKHEAEKIRAGADLAIKVADMSHRHNKEAREIEHDEAELLHALTRELKATEDSITKQAGERNEAP